MYTGVWSDDIPKCGTVEDFGRHEAPRPTTYPLPEVSDYINHHCINVVWLVRLRFKLVANVITQIAGFCLS